MGDRANIVVRDSFPDDLGEREAVFLYTHWRGYDLPALLKEGLAKGVDRWTDAPYLARILFQTMLGDDEGTTGYGVSTRMGDNSYPLLVVDTERQVVVEYPEAEYREHGLAKLSRYRGTPFAKYRGKWKPRRTT